MEADKEEDTVFDIIVWKASGFYLGYGHICIIETVLFMYNVYTVYIYIYIYMSGPPYITVIATFA